MKKKLLLPVLMLLSTFVFGQFYYVPSANAGKNPRDLNKDVENPATAQGGPISLGWKSIWAGPSNATVAYSTTQTLPFAFMFNDSSFTTFKASNCGIVTFDVASTTKPANFNVLTLPSNKVPSNSICISGVKPINNTSFQSNIITKTFGTAPNRQFWIQYSFFTDPNLQTGWTYWGIVLEETTNKIHIVDMKTLCVTSAGQLCNSNVKLSVGVQTDSTTATTVAGSPALGGLNTTVNLFSELDNSFYTFIKGTQPVNDVEGISSKVADFLPLVQAPFTLNAEFKNVGSAKITSADINYSINNGPIVTAALSSISLNKFVVATYAHPTKWTPASAAIYKVCMWLSNINGVADEVGANDSVIKSVNVLENFEPRIPLHEVFTSSTCGPCRPGNINLDQTVFPQIPGKYTVVKYQMSWPGTGDPYTTAEGNVRRGLYNVTSIPNMQVDGGWNGNAGNYNMTLFNQFQAKPSFIKINSTHVIDFKKVTVNVKITPLADYNNPNLRLFVVLTEKRTTKNIKSNGETEFFNVMKKMMPNASGTVLGAVTKNVEKTFSTMTYIVPGNYRLSLDGQAANNINLATENNIESLMNCEVVVFIQDIVTKEVYQSSNSTGTVLGLDELDANSSLSIYPNPSNQGFINVEMVGNNLNNASVNVYNAIGQVVYTSLENATDAFSINTQSFAKGIYILKVENNGVVSTKQFIVE